MKNRLSALLLVLASSAALLTTATGPASAAPGPIPLGPGGVLDLHLNLFTAIDVGDAEAIRGILGGRERGLIVDANGKWGDGGHDLRMFLPGPDGKPHATDEESDALKLLVSLGTREEGSPWKTRILEGWMDCPSADVSFATLTFERVRTEGQKVLKQRYNSTSLVSHTDEGWRLWHFHVSPAK